MTLRGKTLSVVGLTIAGLIAALYAVSSTVLLARFRALEQETSRQNLRRVVDALREDLSGLSRTCQDWAAWDESYAFVRDGNRAFVESNFQDSTLGNLRLNLMLFLDVSGKLVYGKAFDLEAQREVPLPAGVAALARPGSPLLRHPDARSCVSGVVQTAEGPLLLVSRPIVTTEWKGPIRGAVVMARYLDGRAVARLGALAHVAASAYPPGFGNTPADVRAAAELESGRTDVVKVLGRDAIAAYGRLPDLQGKTALVLRVETPRAIYKQGLAGVRYLLSSLVAVGAVFLALTLLVLEHLVLRRVARLSAEVASIGVGGELVARVTVSGRDELSALAAAVNGTLAALAAAFASVTEASGELASQGAGLKDAAASARQGAKLQIDRCSAGAGKARDVEQAVLPLGDLSARLRLEAERSASSIEEIMGVTQTVQAEMENLCAGVEAASSAVKDLDDATTGVAAVAVQVGGVAQSVAASAAIIDTVSDTLRSGAREGRVLVSDLAERASEGRVSMDETEKGMARISQAVGAAVERFDRLGEELGRVGRVTQVIDDIAGRTNLLSLNAAIIAAQAGEQGKAFAVVAAEIRSLAEKTALSTREIRSLVEGLREGARGAAEAIDEGAARVAEGAQRVAQTGGILQAIHESAQHSASRLREIDEAAGAQAAEAFHVAEEIRQVSRGVADIVAHVQAQEERTREIRRALADMEGVAKQTVLAADEQSQGTGFFARTVTAVNDACQEVDAAIAAVGGFLQGLRGDLEALAGQAREEAERVAQLEVRGDGLAALAGGLRDRMRSLHGAEGRDAHPGPEGREKRLALL